MTKDFPCLGVLLQRAHPVLLDPAIGDGPRGIAGIAQQRFGYSLKAGCGIILEFAHVTVVGLDTHALHALDVGCRRALVDDHLARPAQVRGERLVKEVDVEARHDIGKQAVNVLEGLVVGTEGLDELGRGVEEFLGHDSRADVLQQGTPFGDVGPVVWRPEEEHTVRRHEDGTQVFNTLVLDAIAIDQGPFDDQTAQRVADEDDGTVRTASKLYAVSIRM